MPLILFRKLIILLPQNCFYFLSCAYKNSSLNGELAQKMLCKLLASVMRAVQSNLIVDTAPGMFPGGVLPNSQMPGGTFLGLLGSASSDISVASDNPSIEVEATANIGFSRSASVNTRAKKNSATDEKVPQQSASVPFRCMRAADEGAGARAHPGVSADQY